ncbi:MAG: hypothetical protein O7E52_15040, partial [Candidatus Poribacteria bacterium]|nr:hypothetical protein [Candidatus Poribacteria bacterium]
QIEEWWYWTQGVRFTFEAVGAGWKLQNRKDFESKADALAQLKELEGQFEESKSQRTDQTQETTSFNALIYYSYDNVIWGYVPNGMRQPMGAGAHPTASLDGRLTYLDLEGNVILHDADAPQGRLLLEKRDLATDVALSPDGDYLAFARPSVDRRQLYIRHIPSQEEIRVPSTAQEMFTPAWNRSGELLAYSTKGSIENPEVGEDRNIYVYDLASQRIEPIRLGAEDDAEPTWSPSDPNLLAFSRADGQHRQIWIVEFSPDGEPRENQLTRYGGEKPVWLPDGSAVLYENNGQLWLVSKDATENQPLLVKGRVVFGHEPYASPSPSP